VPRVIALTRLNGQPVMLNSDLIESIEQNDPSSVDSPHENALRTRETVITLTTGNVVVVREPLEEIERKVVAFKQKIFAAQKHGA
jgi:uncharacterized protein YlzI (FlbEa/FlbD family)